MSITRRLGVLDIRMRKRFLILAIFLPVVGCGGSKNSTTAPPAVTVQLNQTSVTLSTGAQEQFAATVQGTSNTAVTWSVDSVSGGNATVGTISSMGMYTAPILAGNHAVTATSVASPTSSANASVTVQGIVSISPGSATLGAGATQQFSASVQGQTNPTLTWSVDGVNGGNSSVGTISSNGLYTAPSQVGNHTIGASIPSPASGATAGVTIYTFSLSPGSALLNPGATQQFNASLQGLSSSSVTWSVDGNAGGNSSVGTISSSGLYTAPNSIGAHTISAISAANSSITESAPVTVVNVAQSAVLTYHNDDARDGAYTQEVTLMPSNVNSSQFGKLVSYAVDGQIYGQPLYVPQLQIPNQGTRDVVFVATQNNSVYAFDADATSSNPTTLWQINLGASVPKDDEYGVWPNVGILSTPVIDASTNIMYLVAEVSGQSGSPFLLHAIDITTGKDVSGSPVQITASYSSDVLETSCYQRMALALNPVTNWIYIAFGSCTHGWLLAYDKTSLVQEAVFDDTAGGAGGGLWASDGAPAIDDTTGDLYLMSGTDSGDQQWINGSTQVGYNDSFLRLDPTALSVLDYFSPNDNYTLALNDADLGSGSNILLPGSSTYPHETVGGGKDGNIFVINRDQMGGFNDGTNNVIQTVHTGASQYDNIFSTPVYWNGFIYYHCSQDVLRAFTWNAGADAGQQLSSQPASVGSTVFNMHGATASLSANGSNNGILWEIDNSAYIGNNPSTSGPSVLHAYDATNVATELYNSSQAGSRDQAGLALKFTVPTIANGRVFVPTATELDIYGLLGQ